MNSSDHTVRVNSPPAKGLEPMDLEGEEGPVPQAPGDRMALKLGLVCDAYATAVGEILMISFRLRLVLRSW
jgi:hypothetical protein